MSGNIIISPVGDIVFSALRTPRENSYAPEKGAKYSCRLEFDGSTEEGKAFREAVAAVNPGIISTKNTSSPDHFRVNASSKYAVKVYNESHERYAQEEIPLITAGKASIMVVPYTGSRGGSIKLIGVLLKDDFEVLQTDTEVEYVDRVAEGFKSISF